MKKLFLIAFATLSVLSNSAFSKTQGSYIGADYIATRVSTYQRSYLEPNGVYLGNGTYHVSGGAGLSYKYAFNFNNFFIAPGFILEKNSFGDSKVDVVKEQGRNGPSAQIRNRYGLKVDVGYDVTNHIAPYLTGGYAWVNYKTKYQSLDYDKLPNQVVLNGYKNSNDGNIFGGFGIKVNLLKNTDLNLEYNYQRYVAKAKVSDASLVYLRSAEFVGSLHIFKAGLSYRF
ncbi:MAG: outer membrane beta-barrel protein [Rickettsiales bacterium]|nr:outer membrane beta-barrel protein [Rickettsiales bacterium]